MEELIWKYITGKADEDQIESIWIACAKDSTWLAHLEFIVALEAVLTGLKD